MFGVKNISCGSNHHIRVISGVKSRSDAEKSALITGINYILTYSVILNCKKAVLVNIQIV